MNKNQAEIVMAVLTDRLLELKADNDAEEFTELIIDLELAIEWMEEFFENEMGYDL